MTLMEKETNTQPLIPFFHLERLKEIIKCLIKNIFIFRINNLEEIMKKFFFSILKWTNF